MARAPRRGAGGGGGGRLRGLQPAGAARGGGPVARLPALLAAAALLAAGCGGSSSQPARKHVHEGPALCTRLHARVVGHVDSAAATELSGLVLSRTHHGVLWSHNDSGGLPELFAIGLDGRLRGTLHLIGATNVDWEDIAAAGGSLYAGDIGDNLAQRPSITVYKVSERSLDGWAQPERFDLRYPDGAHDAEALLVDPTDGSLVVITKSLSGEASAYEARPGRETMRRVARIRLGNALPVTAADVSADGRTVVVRTYDRLFVWSRRRGETLAHVFHRSPCTAGADLLVEGQGESAALTKDGRALYTVPEGKRPPLRRWAPGPR
ncbi:MAG TPA: hypothetical protein VGF21_07800 [Thermoleophilaceae bacterium]